MSQRDPIIAYFANYIESELGIVYADHNDFQLQKRLDEIVAHLGLENLAGLYAVTKHGGTEIFRQLLLDSATNNETSFFRDPLLFEALRSYVIPELANSLAATQHLRIWSAACSTGQEPLSIAITIDEWVKQSGINIQPQILATDISERALAKCRSSLYSESETHRGLSTERLASYFLSVDKENWTPRAEIKTTITYQNLNLKNRLPFTDRFDLVLCRNVLIYQSVEGKIEIINRISQAIRPGGMLILGFGESLIGLSQDYERVVVGGVVVFKRKPYNVV
jgi:chemotaxis protein methyltransferase CheR